MDVICSIVALSSITQNVWRKPSGAAWKQLAGFSGYNTTTVINWCNKNLKHFNIAGRFLIPKISATEYLASPQLCSLPQKSKKHKELLTDFLSTNGISG